MNAQTSELFAFGACHVDWIARLGSPALPASVPGITETWFGGAAFNATRHVAAAGIRTVLWSAGDIEAAKPSRAGVELRPLPCGCSGPPSYTAILDPGGELVAAVSDMRRYDEMDAVVPEEARRARHILVDANLAPSSLSALFDAAPASAVIYAMAVSPAKVSRLVPFAKRIDLLFANDAEIEALDAASAGFRQAVVTNGPNGFRHIGPKGTTVHRVASATPVDVTGAGDAITGGFIGAAMAGADLKTALAAAEAAARRTIMVRGPYPLETST